MNNGVCKRLLTAVLVILLAIMPHAAVHAEARSTGAETASVEVSASEKDLLELLLAVKGFLEEYHVSSPETLTMYEGMMKGLLESFSDPYTEYLTEKQMAAFEDMIEGSYSGVGMVMQMVDGEVVVVSTFPDSPAERAGVRSGDVILRVNGTEYTNLDEVGAAIRGPLGTSVILEMLRKSTDEHLTFVLERETIIPPSVEAEDLGDGLYYMRIDQFDAATEDKFPLEMERILAEGARGLLLDLRNNTGGLLQGAVNMTDLLVPRGPIVEVQARGEREVILGQTEVDPIPVVVLINGHTASASEIMAGAIRDYGVGVLVGTTTYGKGCIQQVLSLGEGLGGIRVTIADFYTPSGHAISGNGLKPDVWVDDASGLPSSLVYKRDMRAGSIGLDVLSLQEALSFLGYYNGGLDGVWGPLTESAVRACLQGQSVSFPGFVGSDEIDAVNRALREKVIAAPDVVLERGLQVLKDKLLTDEWPAA